MNDKNVMLTKILKKYLHRSTVILTNLKQATLQTAEGHFDSQSKSRTNDILISSLKSIFMAAAKVQADEIKKLRRAVYLLSALGSAKSIALAMQKNTSVLLTKQKLDQQTNKPSPSGGTLEQRMGYFYLKLFHKVEQAINLALINQEESQDAVQRIEKAFPRKFKIRKERKTLQKVSKITEADKTNFKAKSLFDVETDFIDQQEFDNIVSQELRPQLDRAGVFGRSTSDVYGVDGEERYGWELEKEITQDFVEQVRAGENDAANKNGIYDFMWITVLDDRTDQCCEWRDGLTSEQIEEKLDSSDALKQQCDAITPPAHFNCRCQSAPMSDAIPEKDTESNLEDFHTWLSSKTKK